MTDIFFVERSISKAWKDGDEIENPYPMAPYQSFLTFEEGSFMNHMPTDTCITVDGPHIFTKSGDTLSYNWQGMMDMVQILELKDGQLLITMPMANQDFTTGEVLSTTVFVMTYNPYTGTIPESSWPTEACWPWMRGG